MTTRRRRGPSESDLDAVVITGNNNYFECKNREGLLSAGFSSNPAAGGSGSLHQEEGSFRGNPPTSRPSQFGLALGPDMIARDRTNEFATIVKSLQNQYLTRAPLSRQARETGNRVLSLADYGEFMRVARVLGRSLTETFGKLEELTLLAKSRSLFDDNQTRIQDLTNVIKSDLSNLNRKIGELQDYANRRNGFRASSSSNKHHLGSHSASVVVSLQTSLAKMSSNFKDVLVVRTENLKKQKNRQDQFTQGPLHSTLPPSAIKGYHQGSVLLADHIASSVSSRQGPVPSTSYQGFPSSSDNLASMSGPVPPPPLANGYANPPNYSQLQMQQQVQLIEEDAYHQDRAETMQNIESTIVELGGIFQQLAHMVKEQEEMVQRIDTNVEDTQLNVEAAHSEILKYFRSVSSNRWLMIKIFAVLMFFFIIFVVFFA